MRRCEDEKMRYRPPLLEEPCAQTLSGKRYGSFITLLINRYVVTCTPIDDFDGAVMQQIARLGAGGTSAARKNGRSGWMLLAMPSGDTARSGGPSFSVSPVGLLQKLGTKKKLPCDIYIYIYYIYTLIYFGVGVLHYH